MHAAGALILLISLVAAAQPDRAATVLAEARMALGGEAPVAGVKTFFADYRDVDGLTLPFRIRRAAGADTTEETTFDGLRINARIDPGRFRSGR